MMADVCMSHRSTSNTGSGTSMNPFEQYSDVYIFISIIYTLVACRHLHLARREPGIILTTIVPDHLSTRKHVIRCIYVLCIGAGV